MSSVLRSAGVLAIVIAGVALAPVTASAQTPRRQRPRRPQSPSPKTSRRFSRSPVRAVIGPARWRRCRCSRIRTSGRGRARSSSSVVERQMPPWGIDPHVGIQSFKNDPSLREDEIEKITKWVDAGAPLGNIADMPKPREFDDSDRWHIGKPDLIVTSPPHTVPAEAVRLVGQLLRRHRPHRGSLHQGDREQAREDRRRASPAHLRRRRRRDRRQQRRRQQRRRR